MAAVAAPILIERTDVHKSCKSLEALVSVLSNYTEAANALAVVQKKLAKALKEAATIKGTNNVPANAMVNSAGVFEALAEVDSKFAKVADREAEYVGSELRKWFKKLAKEERAHDDRIATANGKIKQAGQAYEKKAKRKDRDSADEHTRYLAILNTVGPEMSQDKYNHNLMVTQRHTLTLSGCAAAVSRLAEAEWARSCESVRRSAPGIGGVGEWRALCEAGWTNSVPNDLPDLGAPEPLRERRDIDANDKTYDATRTLMPPPNSTHEYPDSPISPTTTRNLPSTGRSSEANSAADHTPLRPPSPSPPSAPEPTPNVLRKNPERSNSANAATAPPMLHQTPSNEITASPEPSVNSNSALTDLSSSSGDIRSQLPPVDERDTAPDPPKSSEADATLKPVPKRSQSHDPPPPFASRESLPDDRSHAKTSEPANERGRDQRPPPSSPISPRATRAAALDRRVSVESSASSTSLVAAMRDKYDTRPIKPASPPPRDLPRMVQSVTDLASRYSPADSPASPHRGLAAERFPTFQDRYPRHTLERDRYRSPPEAPAAERDYFAERDDDRHHTPTPTSTADRNRFLRDDRERYLPRSPERLYADEMGMRDRTRRIDTVAEERALQAREDQLRERERQLDVERARIASARGGGSGYGSDTGRRRESPEPMAQSLRPPQAYDHSPSCGCQRCSARHYASSTPSLPRTYEKPEPPIKLRPDKPKNWIRRMSMPVASLVAPAKSPGAGIAGMALPEEDGRIMRRSFEMEREAEVRYGGTTRR